MTELDKIAAQVVQTFDASVSNVVRDAFRLGVPPEEEYDESTVSIEELDFASFAVSGLAATADAPADGQVRSSSEVTIPLQDSAGGHDSAGTTVTLYGPGDVVGIDHDQIVRRYPAPGTLTAEETVLAHVELDRPELPWTFSAARAEGSLRPWVALVVAERSTVEWEARTGQLPVLRVPLDQLPPLEEAHLWAHAQAARSDAPLEVRLSPEYAPVNLSRLVSPRVLAQDTDYVAAVVPTTDVGARAGLGTTGGTLGPAWGPGGDDPVRLPVLDSWEFRTGPDGDFATLALRVEGIAAPYEVGRRHLDVSTPGRPMHRALDDDAAGAKQVLRCALFSPSPPPTPEAAQQETATWPDEMTAELRAELDRPAQVEGAEERTDGVPDLPIVGPRIYAALHRGSPTVTGTDWFAELNLAPTHRVVAGLGTRVVQRDQEQLMQAAWAQVGEVEKANRAIDLARLAELLAQRVHQRLGALEPGRLLQVAAPLASRVVLQPGRTLAAEVEASATPRAAVSGAFRRTTRPGGPLAGRAADDTRARVGTLVGQETLRDFTRLYRNPDGIGGLSPVAVASLDTLLVERAIDVPAPEVAAVLERASADAGPGLVAHLTDSSQWQAPAPGLDLGAQLVDRWSGVMLHEQPDPAIRAVRDQRVGPLAAELATSPRVERLEREGGLDVRRQLERHAIEINNQLVLDLVVPEGPVVRPQPGPLRPGPLQPGRLDLHRTSRHQPVGGDRVFLRDGHGLSQIDPEVLEPIARDDDPRVRAHALEQLAAVADITLSPILDRAGALTSDDLREQMVRLVDPGDLLSISTVPRPRVADVSPLLQTLAPSRTVRAALDRRLRLGDAVVAERWRLSPSIVPIRAAPHFERPMYQALHDYDPDWLVPGLGLLPADDFVTVLSTNSEFMEAFLVGLSDEMGRELLWRNYPTDQRGTCFRRFWDDRQDELAQLIHAFDHQPLGTHLAVGGTGGSDPRAVIVLKSELVRRYPDLIVQAVKNQGTVQDPVFEAAGSPQQTAEQLFAAHLEPDVALVGVDLSIEELDDPSWWVLVAEHPSATRFDRPRDADLPAGARFLDVPVGDGAAFAAARLHDPVRVAFQATDLIVRGG